MGSCTRSLACGIHGRTNTSRVMRTDRFPRRLHFQKLHPSQLPKLNKHYLQQNFNSFSVWGSGEWSIYQFLQILLKSCLFSLQKYEIIFVIFKNELNAILNVSFSAFHTIINISKCKFWFDHPEFSHMSAGVWDLSSESWAEGVNIGQSTAEILDSQLTRDSQVGNLLEKFMRVINFPIFLWYILDQSTFWHHRSNLEHFSSTLTISTSDKRSMNIQEPIVLEELMGSIGNVVLNSCYGAHNLGSWSQVGNIPESFKSDFFPSQRILFVIILS